MCPLNIKKNRSYGMQFQNALASYIFKNNNIIKRFIKMWKPTISNNDKKLSMYNREAKGVFELQRLSLCSRHYFNHTFPYTWIQSKYERVRNEWLEFRSSDLLPDIYSLNLFFFVKFPLENVSELQIKNYVLLGFVVFFSTTY